MHAPCILQPRQACLGLGAPLPLTNVRVQGSGLTNMRVGTAPPHCSGWITGTPPCSIRSRVPSLLMHCTNPHTSLLPLRSGGRPPLRLSPGRRPTACVFSLGLQLDQFCCVESAGVILDCEAVAPALLCALGVSSLVETSCLEREL
jgi:hypothetical protein